jgi:hypothetical protein
VTGGGIQLDLRSGEIENPPPKAFEVVKDEVGREGGRGGQGI